MSTQCGSLLHSKKTQEKGLEKHTVLSKPVSVLHTIIHSLVNFSTTDTASASGIS